MSLNQLGGPQSLRGGRWAWSADPYGLGVSIATTTPTTSTTWPTANLALYCPIVLDDLMLVKNIIIANGAAVSGNVDVGIYAADGTRLVSSGSTAQAGTNVSQVFDVTDTQLGPGLYYLAIALDNTTGTVFGKTIVAAIGQLAGMAQQASAFPLPATATFASLTALVHPNIGIATKTLV